MTRGFMAGLALLLWLVAPAAAEDRKIEDFYGHFAGNAATGDGPGDTYNQENRAADVEITASETGFSVSWTTLQVQDPDSPGAGQSASVKTATLNFASGPTPGIWYEVKNLPTHTPKKPFTWARLVENKLIITTIIIQENGAYDVTSYERTLTTKDKMELRFTRFKNGDITRRVKAELDRDSN